MSPSDATSSNPTYRLMKGPKGNDRAQQHPRTEPGIGVAQQNRGGAKSGPRRTRRTQMTGFHMMHEGALTAADTAHGVFVSGFFSVSAGWRRCVRALFGLR